MFAQVLMLFFHLAMPDASRLTHQIMAAPTRHANGFSESTANFYKPFRRLFKVNFSALEIRKGSPSTSLNPI